MDTAGHPPEQIAEQPAAASLPAPLFGDYSPAVTLASALILVLAISVIDKLTGYDLEIGMLHLAPIAMATWAAGRAWGLGFAALAMAIWVMMFYSEPSARASLYFYWDGAVLLGVFVAFVLVLGRLREVMHAFELSYLDELPAPAYAVDAAATHLVYGNKAFHETLESRALEELARYPAIEAPIRWKGWRRARLRILIV